MNTDQRVDKVMKDVRHCNDADELRRLSGLLLNDYSAYDQAREALRRAQEVERKYAERAAARK